MLLCRVHDIVEKHELCLVILARCKFKSVPGLIGKAPGTQYRNAVVLHLLHPAIDLILVHILVFDILVGILAGAVAQSEQIVLLIEQF